MRNLAPTALLLASLIPANASAYECTPVPNSSPPMTQAWVIRCIPYFISNDGDLLDSEDKRSLISQSFRVWSDSACTDLDFVDAGRTDDPPGFDPTKPSENINTIASIENQDDLDAFFGDAALLAITLTSFSVNTGEIFDADILLNSVGFRFQEVEDEGTCANDIDDTGPYDLRNTMVHEMGHFIGFDHDNDDQSTMFASARQCETLKRDLTQDNITGVCDVYASAQETRTCAPPPDGYDSGPADPSKFRGQCDRVFGTGNGSSCSCHGHRDNTGLAPFGLLLFLFGAVRLARYR